MRFVVRTRFSYSRSASANVCFVLGVTLPTLISCSVFVAQATASALLENVSDRLTPLRRTGAHHTPPRFVYVAILPPGADRDAILVHAGAKTACFRYNAATFPEGGR
ncbi:hypothetical protein [Burkholderia anthina]|uniref:hypothetical protein n=1 Tax=Burkholderia anthina TaxID=179879 RepID=UPI001FC87ECD|nr:hypothetical protein [Burkholderia anthina]